MEGNSPREGRGLMGVGGAVFVVAALVAAVTSPLAGELTRAIREAPAPVAQVAPAGVQAARTPPAVRVLSLPPMFAVANPAWLPGEEARADRARRQAVSGTIQVLAAQGAPSVSPAPPLAQAPSEPNPPVDPAIREPTELAEAKPAPGRSGEAPPDRAPQAGSGDARGGSGDARGGSGDARGGKDESVTASDEGGEDSTTGPGASADARPSRGSDRRPR